MGSEMCIRDRVIYDGLESIVTGEQNDMRELREELVEEVSDMLPK